MNVPSVHRTARAWSLLAVVPGALIGLAFIWDSSRVVGGHRRFTLFDDAMISMTYGRTLARGGGLVWFEGAPRVEGVTNPLWTLYMAALHALGLGSSTISLLVMLTGLVCVLVAALLAARVSRELAPDVRWAPPLVALVVSLTFPVLYWSLRGMEVGWLLALTMASVVVAIAVGRPSASAGDRRRGMVALAVLFVVAIATRLDFVVLAVVITAWLGWVAGSGRPRWTRLAALGSVIVGATVAVSLAQLAYYGEIVTNTYVLKMTGVSLVDRLHRGLVTDLKLVPMLVLAAAGAVVLWRAGDEVARRVLVLVSALGLAAIGYATYVGGDAWEALPDRYAAPFLVAASIVAITGLEVWSRQVVRLRHPVAVVVGAGAVVVGASVVLGVTTDLSSDVVSSAGLKLAGFGLLVGAGLVVLLVPRLGRARPVLLLAIGSALVLFASSGLGWSYWVRQNSPSGSVLAIQSDQNQTDLGLALGAVVAPGGTIGVVQAGAPAYYADRAAVDLLGKSDRHIAGEAPRGEFTPGHNKWDYAYSIEGRPDVIVRGWYDTADDRAVLASAGYVERCLRTPAGTNSVWVLSSSSFVDHGSPLLEPCGADASHSS